MVYAYSGGALIGAQSNHSLNLRTNNTDRVFVSATGNVGIGAAATGYVLEVASDALVNTLRVGLGAGSDSQSTVLGAGALNANSTGGKNTAVGYAALNLATASTNCTAIGRQALASLNNGNNNTAVGYNAGTGVTTGANNTIIGSSAGGTLTTGSTNIFIGAGSTASAAGDSNTLVIGSSTNYVATNAGATTYYATTGASLGYIQIRLNGANVKIQVYTP